MSDAQKPERDRAAEEAQLRAVWANPRGWRYWTSVNNTQIGLWYGSAAFSFMLFAGLLGLLIRAQLAVPENDLLSAELYNQVFTLHGTVMMFLFAVPIFEAVAIFLLPPCSAPELPFPGSVPSPSGAFIGGVFVRLIFFGAAPTAAGSCIRPWPPANRLNRRIWLLGLSFIEVASLAAAVERSSAS